ncbi:MAG: PAS domain S-box protein [Verrucomicrobiales bacterium]|nr:PAS domain S-box protein [Verrucomicrobiales bacterium]
MNATAPEAAASRATAWISLTVVLWILLAAAAWVAPAASIGVWPLGLATIGVLGFALVRCERALGRAKAELQASEANYRRVFDDAVAAILFFDPQGRFTNANRAGLELLGYTREELLARPFADVDAGPVITQGTSRDSRTPGQLVCGEHKLRRKDGSVIVVSGTSQTLVGANGIGTGTLSILIDLTHSRNTEQAWRESQRRLTLFFNQSLDGYYFSELDVPQEWNEHTDKDRVLDYIRSHQRITEVNDAMLAQYGATREEFLGRPVGEFFQHNSEDGRRLHRQLCDRGRLHVETCERREDGGPVWIEGDYVCIYDEQRRITGTFGVQRDITARKLAEEKHAQLEAQLRHAQKLEAIGQLAGGVAHDFNNILAAMMMIQGMIRGETGLRPSVEERLAEMEPLMDRAATLVRQLLLFARRGVMHFQVIDLNQLLFQLLKMLRRLIGEHLRLHYPGHPTPLLIRADPGMIEQVVTNLVVNARDAMPRGGQIDLSVESIDIDPAQVEAQPEARQGSFVRLSVRDTGTGMDAATVRRIFEPFFTTKEVGKGTGLGLSTVQGIIQQHEGWIEVDSAPGQGSCFRILLPAIDSPHPESTTRMSLAPASLPRGHQTILLVEDEPTLRLAMARALEHQGFRVLQAGDGPEVVRRWSGHLSSVDLLLTDVVMPEGMDGFDLADRLRQHRPSLPVIMMTGYSTEWLKRGFEVPVGTRFLQKPCGPRELLEAIHLSLGDRADGR